MSKKGLVLGLAFTAAAGGCASGGSVMEVPMTSPRPTPSFHACNYVRYANESRQCLESVAHEDRVLFSRIGLKRSIFGPDTANTEANENLERVIQATTSVDCSTMHAAKLNWLSVLPASSMQPVNGEIAAAMAVYFNVAERCHANVSNIALHVPETKEVGRLLRQRSTLDARLARQYEKLR